MSEPTFTIGLADLRTLADAMCAVDVLKTDGDRRQADAISAGHGVVIRALGEQAHLVYAPDDGSEKVAA